MTKRKNQASSPLLYWWNEFLFARYFEYETDLPPEELAQKLRGLAHKHQGWMFGLLKDARVTMNGDKGLDFDIQSKRKRKWDLFALVTARAQGTAIVDGGTGNTVVRGSVKFGRLFHIVMLLYLLYFLAIFPAIMIAGLPEVDKIQILAAMLTPLGILGSLMAFYWWRIYADRNDLADLIGNAVSEEKEKRAASRLSVQDHHEKNGQSSATSHDTRQKGRS